MNVHISCPNVCSQLLHISIEYEEADTESVELHLPAWRPGRYELQNFASKLLSLSAEGKGVSSERLPIYKLSRNTWKVETRGNDKIKIVYQFHANTLDAGGSWAEEDMLYINFINCILCRTVDLDTSIDVRLDIPDSYLMETSMKKRDNNSFRVDSYHELVDSPILASSALTKFQYEVAGSSFKICFHGTEELEQNRIIEDFEKFTIAQIRLFGDFPCAIYHFLILTSKNRLYHGVEHADSTVIALGPDNNFKTEEGYNELLGISSHELFHTWNIKRIKPKELTPYNYSKEIYFETGYMAEGITTYYGDLMLARSGVWDKEQFLSKLNKNIKKHFINQGRLVRSLTESSMDLWVDGYRPSLGGRKVSIYTKGALIVLILDLHLRRQSDHKLNVDSIMRMLWQSFGSSEKGYTSDDYQRIIEAYSKQSFQWYFDDYIRGTMDIEPMLKDLFDYVGLDLIDDFPDNKIEKAYGIKSNKGGKILSIDVNAPAYFSLRLSDVIIEWNGNKLNSLEIQLKDNSNANIKIDRRGVIREIKLSRVAESFFRSVKVVAFPNPNKDQLYNYQKWIQGI